MVGSYRCGIVHGTLSRIKHQQRNSVVSPRSLSSYGLCIHVTGARSMRKPKVHARGGRVELRDRDARSV